MKREFANDEHRHQEWLNGTAAGFVTRLFNAWAGQGLPPAPLAKMMVGACASVLIAEDGREEALAFVDALRHQIEIGPRPEGNPRRPN